MLARRVTVLKGSRALAARAQLGSDVPRSEDGTQEDVQHGARRLRVEGELVSHRYRHGDEPTRGRVADGDAPRRPPDPRGAAGDSGGGGEERQDEPGHPRGNARQVPRAARLERALGPEHPALAESLDTLARRYTAVGDLTRPEPLYQR